MKRIKRNSREAYLDESNILHVVKIIEEVTRRPLPSNHIIFNISSILINTDLKLSDSVYHPSFAKLINKYNVSTSENGNILVEIKREKHISFLSIAIVLLSVFLALFYYRTQIISFVEELDQLTISKLLHGRDSID